MACGGTGSSTLNALGSTAFGWLYGLSGSPDPFSQSDMACQAAIADLQAQGLDPTDPTNSDALEAAYEKELASAQAVAQSTPVSNPIQKLADIGLGTATSQTPVYSGNQPPPSGPNYLLIGFIAIVIIGFFFVIRGNQR